MFSSVARCAQEDRERREEGWKENGNPRSVQIETDGRRKKWNHLTIAGPRSTNRTKKKNTPGRRDGWRSTRRKVDLIAVYAVGTYFQTIVKRVGAILTGHSDALTDSPKTKVATNHDRVIVVVVEIRRSFSFLTKIERFDSIERDEDCYKKTKRRKKMGLSKRKKDEGGRERERE